MLPHFCLTIADFPRTESNKVDRPSLARELQRILFLPAAPADTLTQPATGSDGALSADGLVERILSIYSSVLPRLAARQSAGPDPPAAGLTADSDFFSAGGDSLTAVEALWALRGRLGLNLRQADLHLTVNQLSQFIAKQISSRQ